VDVSIAAQGFSAMGSESRLEVLRSLVRAGDTGLPVGDIRQRTGIPASTLTHHLKFLASAGLIRQDRHGRAILNRADFDHLQQLASFILEECCVEQVVNDQDIDHD
jgi:DNA-binding transcriptional ArsR family regulator